MNIRSSINIVLALAIGSAAGAYIDRYYLFGPHRAALDVSSYSTRLMEHSAWLFVLKRNDISCAKKDIQSNISITLKSADFYRDYAGTNPDALKHLEEAIKFSNEALNFQDQVKSQNPLSCS